jgi:ammonium transporter, Amt family
MAGGLFGILMIAFFTQHSYAVASGNANLPIVSCLGEVALPSSNWALRFGKTAVIITVFVLSYIVVWLIGKGMNGITTDYEKEELIPEPGLNKPISIIFTSLLTRRTC